MTTPDSTNPSGFTTSPRQPYSPTHASNPPPPPPKPSSSSQTPLHASPHPRNPPPVPPSRPEQQEPHPPFSSGPPPPEPHEHWLPAVALDKTSAQLTTLLQSPPLLRSIAQTSHPSLHPSNSPLPPLLHQTAHLASHTSARHAHLLALRDATQRHLLQVRALERQWRDKQAMLDRELEPWSAKSLYEGLKGREREEEEVGRVGEASWLDGGRRGGGTHPAGDGLMGEREVEEWVRGWREGRARGWRRREERERWDEGRVGGWR